MTGRCERPPIWLEDRAAQPYLARRIVAATETSSEDVHIVAAELFGWLKRHGIVMVATPFIRYLVTDGARLEVEVGIPVAIPIPGDEPVIAGTLPAGRYLVQRYTGQLVDLRGAEAMLERWAEQYGTVEGREPIDVGTIWRGRIERFLTNPTTEPDPSKWDVEVAYLLDANPTPVRDRLERRHENGCTERCETESPR
jgi:hypothetical protein